MARAGTATGVEASTGTGSDDDCTARADACTEAVAAGRTGCGICVCSVITASDAGLLMRGDVIVRLSRLGSSAGDCVRAVSRTSSLTGLVFSSTAAIIAAPASSGSGEPSSEYSSSLESTSRGGNSMSSGDALTMGGDAAGCSNGRNWAEYR
jgi:hypothetical protein